MNKKEIGSGLLESLTFSNWLPEQPDSNLATEDYAHIFWSSRDSQRRWNDSLPDDPNVATGVGNINNNKAILGKTSSIGLFLKITF